MVWEIKNQDLWFENFQKPEFSGSSSLITLRKQINIRVKSAKNVTNVYDPISRVNACQCLV